MPETSWTKDQQNAINSKNGTVLVSAAAGSGKTAVLVERVIRRLTDKVKPCSADRLLIVTFTNAAADEMKKRISKKLFEMIQNNPYDSNLKRQQVLIKRANIGTMHSFCNNIVKENFYRLNISPNFRICESGEIFAFKSRAMDTLMDEFYNKDDKIFLELESIFGGEKSDVSFTEVIENIYDFVRSFPFEKEWFKEKLSLYAFDKKLDLSQTPFGKIIINKTEESLEFIISLINNSLKTISKDETLLKAYSKIMQKNLDIFEDALKTLKTEKWDNIFKTISCLKFDGSYDRKIKNVSSSECKSILDENKDLINKSIKKIKSNFLYSSDQNESNIKKIYPLVQKLFKLAIKFGDYLDNLKRERNIADFNDLEKWTLDLLVDQTGNGSFKKSLLASEISEKFEEIMIDEYQDTNEIQNMIFKMISKDEKNLFMVGDVKQSIYGFRQARPENFIDKKNKYSNYDPTIDNYPSKIVLGKNFRSSEKIVNCINFIFKNLMSRSTSAVPYSLEEHLVYSGKKDVLKSENVSFEIIYGEKDDQNSSSEIIEARRIANMVKDIINKKYVIEEKGTTRPARYSDICVLLRSTKNSAKIYSQELNKLGVPCASDTSENFFETYEISTILSFLKIIDNPIQDIPLISTLMSPIFGFTSDDLSKIRLFKKDCPIYFSLKGLADSGDENCKKFMKKINSYRAFASAMSIYDLINHIYLDTGYTDIVSAMPRGDIKLSNLRVFLDFSRKYQNDICKDLSEFLLFISKLEEKKVSSINTAGTSFELSNEVRIMSIHKSKGLEFPICILAGVSKQFNIDKKKLLIHPNLGVGFKLKDEKNIVSFNNIQRQAIKISIHDQEIAENLRVLYVALTRAKQKLIITSYVENIDEYIKKMIKLCSIMDKSNGYVIKNCNCFLDWIILCALKSKSGEKIYKKIGELPEISQNEREEIFDINFSYVEKNIEPQQAEDIKAGEEIDSNLILKMEERFNFKYKNSGLQKIPLKITATDLLKKDTWKKNIASSRPAFMSKINLSSSEKGTILHNFMYFADYNKASSNLGEYLSFMVSKGIIKQSEANVIEKERIKNFFDSKIGKKILNSKKLYKEYRFTVNYSGEVEGEFSDASTCSEEGSPVLIGSIDCVFEDSDGEYIIVDYKTDKINSINELSERYSRQLNIYKSAFEKCEDAKVKELIIYSFHLNSFTNVN